MMKNVWILILLIASVVCVSAGPNEGAVFAQWWVAAEPEASAGFPPQSGSLWGWWDASDVSSLTISGGRVDVWADTRGTGQTATDSSAGGGYRAYYNATGGPGGAPIISNNVQPYVTIGYTLATNVTLGPKLEIFVVGDMSTPTWDALNVITRSIGANTYIVFGTNPDYTSQDVLANGAAHRLAFTDPGGISVYHVSHNLGVLSTMYINNVFQSSGSTTFVSIPNCDKILSWSSWGSKGAWCEMLIWNGTQLTTIERGQVVTYLRAKWGI